jgi:hypothetical protein
LVWPSGPGARGPRTRELGQQLLELAVSGYQDDGQQLLELAVSGYQDDGQQLLELATRYTRHGPGLGRAGPRAWNGRLGQKAGGLGELVRPDLLRYQGEKKAATRAARIKGESSPGLRKKGPQGM